MDVLFSVFTYDVLSRLTGYSKTQGNQTKESQTFNYDANGNRLNLIENKDTSEEIQTIYTILENSNRLTKVADTDYQYDNNGNIINDGDHSYTYDSRNRLVSIDNGTTASYLYNANNMRVMKTVQQPDPLSPQVVRYGWDNDRIFAEYDASGNPIQETVYFGSTPIALLKDGNTYRIFADQIDTPRVITDNTNTTLWAWDSKPFGESQPDEDVDGDNTKLGYNLRFPGQYYDAETGKHYNFNRDYDPVTGRYVQSDPIGLDGGMNGYGYVSSPLDIFDLFGKFSQRNAIRIANEITARGFIKHKGEADWLYENNTNPNLRVRVNASFLEVNLGGNQWYWDQGNNGWTVWGKVGWHGFSSLFDPDFQVHGSVAVNSHYRGGLRILSEKYDFDIKSWRDNAFRNMLTVAGRPSVGTSYWIDYYGEPYLF